MSAEQPWTQDFPYRNGSIRVARVNAFTWQLTLGLKETTGPTLVEAFETLLGQRPKDPELRVVLAALAWEQEFEQNGARVGAQTDADPDSPGDEGASPGQVP